MVKSNKVYSPQNFLLAVTKKVYIFNGCEDDVKYIEKVLDEEFGEGTFWSYPLNEINLIEADVVLVDCMVCKNGKYEHEYRWFEVHDFDDSMCEQTEINKEDLINVEA